MHYPSHCPHPTLRLSLPPCSAELQLGRNGGTGVAIDVDSGSVPIRMRKTIAVYEAARALIGYITPDFDEIQRVSHRM